MAEPIMILRGGLGRCRLKKLSESKIYIYGHRLIEVGLNHAT